MWFQGGGGICPAKFQLDHIQNSRQSAMINFNMPDIWQTVPDSLNSTVKENVRFQVGIYPEKFQLDQINCYMPDIWQTMRNR